MQLSNKKIISITALPLLLKIATAVLSLLINYLAAQKLSPVEFGLFSLAQVVVLFLITFSKLGLDTAIIKPTATANKDKKLIQSRYISMCIIAVLALSFTSTLLISLKTYIFTTWLNQPQLITELPSILILTWSMTFLAINSGLLKGLKQTNSAMVFNGFASLSFTAVLFMFISPDTATGSSLLKLMAFSTLTACIISFIASLEQIRKLPIGIAVAPSHSLTLTAIQSSPIWFSSMVYLIIPHFSFLLLSHYASLNDIGTYAIALKISATMALVLFAINSVLAPYFAELYANLKFSELKKLANKSNRLLLLAAIASGCILMTLSGWLLSWFGDSFIHGTLWLQILIVGQCINVGTGSVVNLLIMTGHEKIHQHISFVVAGVTIALAMLLIPTYQALGAAITTTVSMSLQNILSLYCVHKFIFNKSSGT